MKRLLSLLFLFVIVAAVWFGARAFTSRGEAKVTIIFREAGELRKGDPVVAEGRQVGRVVRVDSVDEKSAVTVRLTRENRRAILTDSLFDRRKHELVVTNTFAIGSPVENGAVLEAKDDRVNRWLAKSGAAVAPYVAQLREKADRLIDRQFAEWSAKAPDWKKEGKASFERHVAEARRKVDDAVNDLEAKKNFDEARRLKERFARWVEETKK